MIVIGDAFVSHKRVLTKSTTGMQAVPAIPVRLAFRYIEKTALSAICCRASVWVYVCVRIRLEHASPRTKRPAIRSAIRY
jgi:hypothetical protein